MSEIIGYNGPIYMTHPTKKIVPILLEEVRKLNVENKGKANFFSTQMIKNCMKKVTGINLHESVMVDNELEIKAYYAGHVLGAAMFWLKVGSQTVVYTGDFNMNPDRHLGAAWIDKCQPDLLIIESMFATKAPKSNRCRDNEFLQKVHDCMSKGGKVLIPVFIVGRAQEMLILLNSYWEKMNLSYPIYFANDSLTDKANSYYKMFVEWTNQKMAKNVTEENNFELKHIKSFEKSFIDKPGPMVVLATNGMLQQGISMLIFKNWASDEKNLVILPDNCGKGTLGHKILAGAKQVEFRNNEVIDVNLKVEYINFDALADANDIITFIESCEPKNIILVHGPLDNLKIMQKVIMDKFKIKCLAPSIGEDCLITTTFKLPSKDNPHPPVPKMFAEICDSKLPIPREREYMPRILVNKGNRILIVGLYDAFQEGWTKLKNIPFTSKLIFEYTDTEQSIEQKIFEILKEKLINWTIVMEDENTIIVEGVKVNIRSEDASSNQKIVSILWKTQDEDIASYIMYMLQHMS